MRRPGDSLHPGMHRELLPDLEERVVMMDTTGSGNLINGHRQPAATGQERALSRAGRGAGVHYPTQGLRGLTHVEETLLCRVCLILLVMGGVITAAPSILWSMPPSQSAGTAPTLIPPTPLPTQDAGITDVLLTESGLARIQQQGKVRVGTLYNAPPFGLLNIRGQVAGFDADLARSMADVWGVQVEFVQVTRQTALEMLVKGSVDMLMAAVVHQRELDGIVEFSQTYYQGRQAMMVRIDDGAAALSDMANRRVGVVVGTPSESAVAQWQQRSGTAVTIQSYLTLDQGLTALVGGEIDGLAASNIQLDAIRQPERVKILDDVIVPEPYAVALRRQDASLRGLVNRTLQYLVQNGRLNEIYQANFPGSVYPPGLILVWEGLGGEVPRPSAFPSGITYPAQYVIPRLQSGQPIRIAGFSVLSENAPESERRLFTLNRAVVDALAARWGGVVEYIPDSAANALDLVASGQADLAVGVTPDWAWNTRVDFTSAYFMHGDRLMVKKNDSIESFNELRGGKWVGIFASEPGSADRVNALARSVNTAVNIYTMIREQDVPVYLLQENNADVAFGDSLKLIPHVQNNPDALRLAVRCPNCDPWYTRKYVAFAVPYNDLDFRLLVEYTLQEMIMDGTLANLLQPVMLPEDRPRYDIWPGPAEFMGIALYPARAEVFQAFSSRRAGLRAVLVSVPCVRPRIVRVTPAMTIALPRT